MRLPVYLLCLFVLLSLSTKTVALSTKELAQEMSGITSHENMLQAMDAMGSMDELKEHCNETSENLNAACLDHCASLYALQEIKQVVFSTVSYTHLTLPTTSRV